MGSNVRYSSDLNIDALLAATAKVHAMTLVTRNIANVDDLGANLLNPFEPRV